MKELTEDEQMTVYAERIIGSLVGLVGVVMLYSIIQIVIFFGSK